MRLNLRVELNDGSAVDTAATTADQVAWESTYSRSIISLGESMRLTDLCWLAWHSLHRVGSTGLDFDPWVDTVSEVQLAEDAQDPVPLEPTASTSD